MKSGALPTRVWRILRAQLSDPYEFVEPVTGTSGRRKDAAISENARVAGYYANLELPYGANADAVRAARRNLLKRYPPTFSPPNSVRADVAHLLVQRLNDAHDGLLSFLASRDV